MRRGLILVLGLLLASAAMPTTNADARPLLLKILRAGPLGPVFGARPHVSRRAYHNRRAASRAARARAAERSTVPAAAVAGTAAGATAATAATTSNSSEIRSSAEAAKPEAIKPAEATASDAADTQATAAATTGTAPSADPVPLPTAAPAQRNAALATPDDEPEGRSAGEPTRTPARPQTRLGTVGPLAWPSAYEDVIGFTLWPKEYGERLRVHGIGDIVGTALLPSATLAARTRAANVQARADAPNATPVAAGCGSVDLTATDWPIGQINSAVELDAAQRGTLEQLRTALSDAISSIKSTCRGDEASLSPVERLQVMQNTLWAVHDATQLVRGPLAKFYDSLTAEQKLQFAAPAAQADPRARNAMSRADMARMCGSPASSEAPMRQFEQSLRPTKAQRAGLDALQKKSFEMGQFLMASCLKPIPETPAERLDAAADRLTAMIFAVSNVNIALNDFTSQLSAEQKAKLNSTR